MWGFYSWCWERQPSTKDEERQHLVPDNPTPTPTYTWHELLQLPTHIHTYTWEDLSSAWDVKRNFREVWVREGKAQAGRLAPLDGIRAIAFLWVGSLHFLTVLDDFYPSCAITSGWGYTLMCDMIESGECGVVIFFVLSGFLIPFIIFNGLKRQGSINYGSFLYRRFLRIWPSLNFYVLVSMAMLYWAFSIDYEEATEIILPCFYSFWTNMVFVTNLQTCVTGNNSFCQTHLWTVSAEFQMYLFTPLLVALYVRHTALGILVTIVVMLVGVYFRYYSTWCGGAHTIVPWVNMEFYCLGMLVSFSYHESPSWFLLKWMWQLPRWVKISLEMILIIVCVWACSTIIYDSTSARKYSDTDAFLLVASCVALLMRISLDPGNDDDVAVDASKSRSSTVIAAVLSHPFLYPIASLSYTGYLFTYVAAIHTVSILSLCPLSCCDYGLRLGIESAD